jgi:hypothetical protein
MRKSDCLRVALEMLGMKKATFVRHLIREESFSTASEVLADAAQRMGDMHLRASRKP